MIQIIGPALSQWDVGRSVKITNIEADCVHLANKGDSKAVIMEIADAQAKIPDYLLQTGKQLCVYAVKDGITVESKTFYVQKRERPENYVYEDDQRNYIYELITSAETAVENANQAAEDANDAVKSINDIMLSGKIVKTVNGVAPDENGNVQIEVGSGSGGGSGGEVFVPKAQVTQTANGATITITDQHGTSEATVNHGKDGKVSDEQIEQAVSDYMTEHPIEVPDSSQNVYIGPDEPTGENRPLYWLDTSMDDVPVQPEEPDVPVEPDEPETVTYTIINKLTNVTNSNTAASIEANASYKATLTAADGYELGTVTVTMGGTDVTSTVYADGVVNISAVTGNVVITATAKEASGETEGGIIKLADISVETTAGNDASGRSKAGYTRYKIEGVKTGDIVRLAGTQGADEHGWYDGTTVYSLSDTSWFTGAFQDNYAWRQFTWIADKDYDYLYFGSMTSRLETYPNSAATIEKAVN